MLFTSPLSSCSDFYLTYILVVIKDLQKWQFSIPQLILISYLILILNTCTRDMKLDQDQTRQYETGLDQDKMRPDMTKTRPDLTKTRPD
jgi:hypothetical protein